MSGVNFDNTSRTQYEQQRSTAVTGQTTAQNAADAERDKWNKAGYVDDKGNPLKFNTLKEWQDAVNNHTIYKGSPAKPIGKSDEDIIGNFVNPLQNKLDYANNKVALLDRCIAGLKEDTEVLAKLKKMLESGDIEGAVMVLQSSRAKVLEAQLSTRIEGMQARNAMIRAKNDDMALKQGELGGLGGDNQKADYANKQKEVTKIKGDIDQLNSDSSLDMIGIQTLVNKRNEAFDTLSNLVGKFQKTIDGIVGNMR